VHVCHYPPGTSKWNAIQHQLFSFISINWRGKPLICYEFMLELIRHTTTKAGLRVHAMLDPHPYPIGIKISNKRVLQNSRNTRLKKGCGRFLSLGLPRLGSFKVRKRYFGVCGQQSGSNRPKTAAFSRNSRPQGAVFPSR
jgi:hypothetical protein